MTGNTLARRKREDRSGSFNPIGWFVPNGIRSDWTDGQAADIMLHQ
jgi:hypothetical protein